MRQLATLSLLYYFSAWQCALLVVAADADRSSSQSSSSSPSSSRSSSSSAKNNQSLSAGKLRSLGEIALSERKYSEAESYYRQAIALEPDNGNNYYKLYKVHNRMKSLGDALSALTEACAREPAKEEWRVQKAKLLASLGRCEEAAAEYEDFRRQHLAGGGERALDGETEAGQCAQLTQLALQAFSNREFQKSIHYFTSLLSHVNEATDLLFMKAQAEYEVGDYYGVVSDMGKILKSFPKHLEAYQLRGEAYFRLNEMEMAVKHFREGLKLDPEHKGESQQVQEIGIFFASSFSKASGIGQCMSYEYYACNNSRRSAGNAKCSRRMIDNAWHSIVPLQHSCHCVHALYFYVEPCLNRITLALISKRQRINIQIHGNLGLFSSVGMQPTQYL